VANRTVNSEHNTQTVLEEAQKSFDINVLGVFQTVFAFLPLLREGKMKKIVGISSGMGDNGKSADCVIAKDFQRSIRDLHLATGM
jgi:NAD(P)-dependent dehydrogenase (short-subunit alcohol dehydrogenase family)